MLCIHKYKLFYEKRHLQDYAVTKWSDMSVFSLPMKKEKAQAKIGTSVIWWLDQKPYATYSFK